MNKSVIVLAVVLAVAALLEVNADEAAAPAPSEEIKPTVVEPAKVAEKPAAAALAEKPAAAALAEKPAAAAHAENHSADHKKGKAGKKNGHQDAHPADKEQQPANKPKTLSDHLKKTGKAMKSKKAEGTNRNKTSKAAPKKAQTNGQSSILKKGAGSNKAAKRQNAKQQKKAQKAKSTIKPEEPATVNSITI